MVGENDCDKDMPHVWAFIQVPKWPIYFFPFEIGHFDAENYHDLESIKYWPIWPFYVDSWSHIDPQRQNSPFQKEENKWSILPSVTTWTKNACKPKPKVNCVALVRLEWWRNRQSGLTITIQNINQFLFFTGGNHNGSTFWIVGEKLTGNDTPTHGVSNRDQFEGKIENGPKCVW